MPVDITIPSPGESITEVIVGPWHKQAGEWVDKDETIVEIESDKVTLEVAAPESGLLAIAAPEGTELQVGDVIGSVDQSAERPAAAPEPEPAERDDDAQSAAAATNEVATATASSAAAGAAAGAGAHATSLAKRIARDKGVDLGAVEGTGPSGRITKADVLSVAHAGEPALEPAGSAVTVTGSRGARRQRMTKLRQRIAERLVMAQQSAAMLTTFNEADMSEVSRLRGAHKEAFQQAHGVKLGFMSFFVKACVSALAQHPRINAYIVGDEIEFHDYMDVSVAVGTSKGLVVPVIRNAETMSFAQIESTIRDFAVRAQGGELGIDEMTGGTFTISNGGVYGSLNSTPILNPPQSGILGMHKIMNRPIEDPHNPAQIVLRPMMYLALSYDHRIVDGAEAVGFLIHVKECIEAPERMLIGL